MADWNEQIIETFRANGGEVPRFGRNLVLVHHLGARTGTERISPVMGFPTDDDGWLIVASKGGAPENPAWYHNLLAHPDVRIETPEGDVDVTAQVLDPAARDDAWRRITAAAPGFAGYEQRTTRTIPVVKLTRR
jgi:deazaflavin-dependent oxidoreductase (nitroreductase family)